MYYDAILKDLGDKILTEVVSFFMEDILQKPEDVIKAIAFICALYILDIILKIILKAIKLIICKRKTPKCVYNWYLKHQVGFKGKSYDLCSYVAISVKNHGVPETVGYGRVDLVEKNFFIVSIKKRMPTASTSLKTASPSDICIRKVTQFEYEKWFGEH